MPDIPMPSARILPPRPSRRARRVATRAARFAAYALFATFALSAGLAAFAVQAADPRKFVHLALGSDPPGFDPAGPTDVAAASILEVVFDRLLTYDLLARPAKLVPLAAAALPEITDGGRTYTVRLRHGIRFTPDPAFKGVPRELVAQDFVYSALRFVDPAQRSPYAFLFRGRFIGLDPLVERAKATGRFDYDAKIPGLEAVDRYTLRFRLTRPDYTLNYLLAHGAYGAVAREVVAAYGADIGAHPVGSGPYVLAQWTPGTKIVLEANPAYRGFTWDFAPGADPRDRALVAAMKGKPMPQVGRAEIAIIEEDTARWLAFRTGQLDATTLPPRFAPDALVGDAPNGELRDQGVIAYRSFYPSFIFAAFNFRDPVVGGYTPEKNALRRAIAMAYDREEEIRVVRKGLAVRTQMPIPPDVAGVDPGYRRGIGFDPDGAARLLDRFGYRRGADGLRTLPDGRPLAITLSSGTDSFYRDLEQLWQKSLARIGLKARFEVVRSNENAQLAIACKLPVFQYGWYADYPDGDNFMQLFYGRNVGESNFACYQSAAFDRLYERSQLLPDSPERTRLYAEMARQLEADTVFVPEASPQSIVFVQPWLVGHKAHPFLNTILPYLDVDPARRPPR
jgi:ABC-type transport system substrate-binding protein